MKAGEEGVLMRRVELQVWFQAWLSKEVPCHSTAINKTAAAAQVTFIRDRLSLLVPFSTTHVIGEHHSKSVRLPVYEINQPSLGVRLVLRNNFYDWNVSVISETPVSAETMRGFVSDFTGREKERFKNAGGFTKGASWDYCFFQGFPEEDQFGPWSLDPRKFSLCITDNYRLYTFVWNLTRPWDLGVLGGRL